MYKPQSLPGMMLDPADPINRGLVGWWPLNEGGGNTRLTDISRFNRHMATVNSPKYGVGPVGTALRLVSASSQYASVADPNNAYAFSNTTFSVSLWIKTTTVNANNLIIGKHTGGDNTGWYFNLILGTGMQIALRGTAVINLASASPSTAYIDNKWHHVVGVFTTDTVGTANNLVLYLDGKDDTGTFTNPNAYSAPSSSVPIRIGSREGTGALYYDGAIADVRVFNRRLNSSEVKQLYTKPSIGLYIPNIGKYFVSAGALATSLFDGKIIIKSSGTNLLDGKVQIKDVVTALLDGKVAIGSVQQSLLDGKLTVKDTAVSFLDGKVMVKDIATSLIDGKLEITQGGVGLDTFDGKIQIKDALTALVDGKVIVKSVATDLLDGKLTIGTLATSVFDGKVQIKDIATALLDGKIQVKNATVDLLDGKIIISDGVTSFSKNNQLLIDSIGGKVLQIGNTRINSWNTAGRPASPKTGTIGLNTQTVALDIYDGSNWKSVTLS